MQSRCQISGICLTIANPKACFLPLNRSYYTLKATVRIAERSLAANSGKPLDGIYTSFNRRLCRPFVRLLSHTRVTPNPLSFGGLLVAIVAGLLFARGSYVNDVRGALLFFVSGLFDEMDGMLARIKFRESAFGTWLEGFVDNGTYLVVFAESLSAFIGNTATGR